MALRRYILGLALVAATAPIDGFLRAGCLLTPDHKKPGEWNIVDRSGKTDPVVVDFATASEFAKRAANAFERGPDRLVTFHSALAKEDIRRAG